MSPATGEPDVETSHQLRSRRDLIRAGAAAAVAGILGVFGSAQVVSAKNGQPVRAGERTTATKVTIIDSNKAPALQVRSTLSGQGVGLRAIASGRKAVGVNAVATASKGESVGVLGQTASADGTAGRFVATAGGTAVEARSRQKNGVALRTEGRLQLTQRSGVTEVSGGAEFVIPVAGGLSSATFVLATLQDHNPGVHVESATVLDAEDGKIVVRLNQALAEPAKVGWIVLD
jgi:hypothetical protein